jgi:hypothetical protein
LNDVIIFSKTIFSFINIGIYYYYYSIKKEDHILNKMYIKVYRLHTRSIESRCFEYVPGDTCSVAGLTPRHAVLFNFGVPICSDDCD